MLVTRMIGCYPAVNLHDPKTYAAEAVLVLLQYTFEIADRAIEQVKLESPTRVPTVPQIKAACQEQRRDHAFTYAQTWERQSQQQLLDRAERETEPEPLEYRKAVAERILTDYHSRIVPETKPQQQTWKRFSDDELRAIYAPKKLDEAEQS